MARSPRGKRSSSGSGAEGKARPVRRGLVLDGLAVVTVVLALAITMVVSADARLWALESLGYGWIPAGLWLGSVVYGLRYHIRSFRRLWQWWVLAAGGAAIVIGVLSFFHPGFGVFAVAGLSGKWGTVLGGSPLFLGIAKLLAIAILTPVVVFPRRVGPFYARGFEGVGQGVRTVAENPQIRRGISSLTDRLRSRTKSPQEPSVSEASPETPAVSPIVDREPAKPEAVPVGKPDVEPDAISESSMMDVFVSEELALYIQPAETDPAMDPSWLLPTAGLLSTPEPVESNEEALDATARLIEQTLASHGVNVTVADTQAGPRLIRFGLDPGWLTEDKDRPEGDRGGGTRVRVQSIVARQNDLALALKTPSIRIQLTIPGEALVGLEVPSPTPRRVGLKEMVESEAFTDCAAKGGLPIAIGQDIAGEPEVLDLAGLPDRKSVV